MNAATRCQVTDAASVTTGAPSTHPSGMAIPSPGVGFAGAQGRNLEWRRPGEALRLLVTGRTVRPAAPVAAVVGTVLSAVNQGAEMTGGRMTWASGVRIAVNYLVPFCVASYGYLGAWRTPGPEPEEPGTRGGGSERSPEPEEEGT